ncbi:MAG: hypothetical protein HDKAJFGB_02931 [Anaerolineae bacterium]|nr:hypothetical protein [Anaerolineae bacterium]RIK18906.1 MAG: hypothetical protein DCC52_15550 [Chloroflexota bacterium]
MATIFAGDESGNLGFVFDKGDTRYYVISLARFPDPDGAREQIKVFKGHHHFSAHEFSFHEILAQRWSNQVFDFISTLEFHGWVLIVDKRKLSEFYRLLHGRSLYVLFLTEAISKIPFEARDKSILVLDEIDSSGQILHDIRRGLRVRGARQGFKKIVAKRSLREPLIQVSDLIAGVVHRWKQFGETTLLEGIAHRLTITEFQEEKKTPS